jgi:hypothetical protein
VTILNDRGEKVYSDADDADGQAGEGAKLIEGREDGGITSSAVAMADLEQ